MDSLLWVEPTPSIQLAVHEDVIKERHVAILEVDSDFKRYRQKSHLRVPAKAGLQSSDSLPFHCVGACLWQCQLEESWFKPDQTQVEKDFLSIEPCPLPDHSGRAVNLGDHLSLISVILIPELAFMNICVHKDIKGAAVTNFRTWTVNKPPEATHA